MKVNWLAIGCGVFLACLSNTGAAEASATNEVTALSIVKDLYGDKMQSAHLLAFKSTEDERPWYYDEALLLVIPRAGEWMLLNAVRNPKFPKGHRGGSTKWHPHQPTDTPWIADRRFKHRPTQQEVDQFIKENRWEFWVPSRGTVRLAVYEAVWEKELGYKPAILKKGGGPAP